MHYIYFTLYFKLFSLKFSSSILKFFKTWINTTRVKINSSIYFPFYFNVDIFCNHWVFNEVYFYYFIFITSFLIFLPVNKFACFIIIRKRFLILSTISIINRMYWIKIYRRNFPFVKLICYLIKLTFLYILVHIHFIKSIWSYI